MLPDTWSPKLRLTLRDYNSQKFLADIIAGLTVGIVALPLAMAFGISSGVTPQAGIYTAVVAGFIISALGGSKTQIGGPTGAFVVIVSGIVAKFGLSGLTLVTLMAGVILILMGITGLGATVRFIPRPVTIGFTNGIALLIASTQIRDFLGLRMDTVPSEFLPKMVALGEHFTTLNPAAIALGLITLAIILLTPRVTKRVPGSIIALILTTAAALALTLPIETIGSKFGGIPRGMPHFAWPAINFSHMALLIPAAFTVAMLAAIESLLSAVVADSMSGDRHNSAVELTAQGIANIASSLFGGIPATGAIARTATNIRSGAVSPVSGMVHAVTLLLILLIAAPIAKFIPLATLAGVLFVVAYNMGEWKEIPQILRLSKTDIAVWAVTFALTVFADLTVAVEVGMGLAALLYIARVAETTSVVPVTQAYIDDSEAHSLQGRDLPSWMSILRIHGPFLFGTTEKLIEATEKLDEFPQIVVLRLRNMTALDATGVYAIETFAKRLRDSGRTLILCGARDQPGRMLTQAEVAHEIGQENILPNVDRAFARAEELHAGIDPDRHSS